MSIEVLQINDLISSKHFRMLATATFSFNLNLLGNRRFAASNISICKLVTSDIETIEGL